ncbi:carotenoid oxygenase family protein [Variovorax sp. LARHSF232]
MNWTDGTLKASFEASRDKPWTDGFATVHPDNLDSGPLHVEGELPEELRGTFFRNGPGRHELGQARYSHKWDGDGMVQAFRFTDEGVRHEGRFVRTAKYLRESEAGHPLVSAFGSALGDQGALDTDIDEMNVANISVCLHGGELLALWEAGSAYQLDPYDLRTIGLKDWKSSEPIRPFSAHPKIENDGGLWNFGADPIAGELSVFHINQAGDVDVCRRLKIEQLPPIHDFAVTARHLVFILSPLVFSVDRLRDGVPFARSSSWEPEHGTRALVLSKEDFAHRWYRLPPLALFHIGNAWEDERGTIRLDFMGADDPRSMMSAWSVMTGQYRHARGSVLRLLTLPPAGDALMTTPEGLGEGEFPVVDPLSIGRRYRHVLYVGRSANRPANLPGWDQLVAFDVESGRTSEYNFGDRWFIEEHVFARTSDAGPAAWIVGTGLDMARRQTALLVFSASRVSAGPVAVAYLPRALPFGLHGTFVPASARTSNR